MELPAHSLQSLRRRWWGHLRMSQDQAQAAMAACEAVHGGNLPPKCEFSGKTHICDRVGLLPEPCAYGSGPPVLALMPPMPVPTPHVNAFSSQA
jgi:hypothetical protein